MELPFIKIHTAERDAVIVDASRAPHAEAMLRPEIAAGVLHRRRGIGARDLAVLVRTEEQPLTLRSAAAEIEKRPLCVNTILSAARFAIDAGLVSSTSFPLSVDGRIVPIDSLDSRSVMADLGPPLHEDGRTELTERAAAAYTRTLPIRGRTFVCTPVHTGGLHLVFYGARSVQKLAATIFDQVHEEDSSVPAAAGLCFATALDSNRLRIRTWSAQGREQRSDGDSAAAGLVAGVLHAFVERDSMILTRGGELYVLWANHNNHLYVTGTPRYVFTGTYSTD